jgi:hypothetical protein
MRGSGRGAALGDNRPANPKINDVWVTEAGALEYYDGTDWVPYVSPPDWDLPPVLLEPEAIAEEELDEAVPGEAEGADETSGEP